MAEALIFDFDGLLVDTETAVLASWRETFAEFGLEVPMDVWHTVIGTHRTAQVMFDLLEDHAGPLDRLAYRAKSRARVLAMLEAEGTRPGVAGYLDDAAALGLRLGVASSSSAEWVEGHLARLGLREQFDTVVTGDRFPAKPRPDLYLAALAALRSDAADAVAFEDSPNGVTAAKAAGLRCVAVPNPITASLGFDHADLVLTSFTDKSLGEILLALAS
ncbi:HAD family hydrolase [Amycolatopsis sp. cg5]|uniref:HAD family hydrolase n=1 Tax=Amycolatopsis sp. cg5 TaxID=3238802 RepID=UPI0035246911